MHFDRVPCLNKLRGHRHDLTSQTSYHWLELELLSFCVVDSISLEVMSLIYQWEASRHVRDAQSRIVKQQHGCMLDLTYKKIKCHNM